MGNDSLNKGFGTPESTEDVFPTTYSRNKLQEYIGEMLREMAAISDDGRAPRYEGDTSKDVYNRLLSEYGEIPREPGEAVEVLKTMVRKLFAGAVNWKSPHLHYNVGAPTNVAATAAYAAALEANLFNINSGLGGNSLVAEKAVTTALSKLAGVDEKHSHGIFTFGGTGTNLYALKLGINSVSPHAKEKGVPKNLGAIITEDSHFSHSVAADWLGVGTDNIATVRAGTDRRSSMEHMEELMRSTIEDKKILAAVMINGGTTYDHAVDDIKAVVSLRNRLVQEYKLTYSPHIHVDSVIGWAWLVFSKYDFTENPLDIDNETLAVIQEQLKRIKPIQLGDSWGVDFHKGAGCCPIPCSVFMVNNRKKLLYLSKKHSHTDIHQLAEEYSFDSPVDLTLETSRQAGSPMSALAALHTMGLSGYQRNLANLVRAALLTRQCLGECQDIACCNPNSLGYVTMARTYPKPLAEAGTKQSELSDERCDPQITKEVNRYNKAFFEWDDRTRMKYSDGGIYSFSSKYIRLPNGEQIPAIKFIPTSPHITEAHIRELTKTIIERKHAFDAHVWPMMVHNGS